MMSSRFSPKSGMRLYPESAKARAASAAVTVAGRVRIADRGDISS